MLGGDDMVDRARLGIQSDARQRPAEMRDPHRARLRRQDFGEPRGVEMIGIVQRPREFAFAGALGRARSEEHTSELQSLMRISYAVFCLKQKQKYKEKDDI